MCARRCSTFTPLLPFVIFISILCAFYCTKDTTKYKNISGSVSDCRYYKSLMFIKKQQKYSLERTWNVDKSLDVPWLKIKIVKRKNCLLLYLIKYRKFWLALCKKEIFAIDGKLGSVQLLISSVVQFLFKLSISYFPRFGNISLTYDLLNPGFDP